DASHELRTPLTSVRGYSEMLRRGAAASPVDADLARRRIEEESVRMSALVDDMLLIARLDQGRPLETEPVDLQVIARDAAADARRSRDSGGAGLGLSIVNAVVAAHGGHVDVKETSGGGATFEVELPLVPAS